MDGKPMYSGVWPGSLRGSFMTLLLLPSVMQPSAWYLPPWFGLTRALLASVYRSNPLQDIPSTPVTAYHMTQGMDLHVTIRYRRGVGFMGGRYMVSYQGRLIP